MQDPKITVMMTTYNSAPFLHEAIDSILNQTFNDFELLIIDDGSVDGTVEIIASYRDHRIRLIRNPERNGIGYAREKALEIARGKYVAILDSDDIALRDRLELQSDYLDKNDEVHLLGSAYQIIKDDRTETVDVPIDSISIRWKLLFQNCIANSTVMFRKNFAQSIGGYNDKILTGEDFDLWVRFAAYGKIVQLDRPLAQWRRHNRSITVTEPIEVKDQHVWTVVKSIKLQTNQDVQFEVAKYLYGNIPRAVITDSLTLKAFDAIYKCWKCLHSSSDISYNEKKCLKRLAINELFRVTIEVSKSYLAVKATFFYALMINPLFLFDMHILHNIGLHLSERIHRSLKL